MKPDIRSHSTAIAWLLAQADRRAAIRLVVMMGATSLVESLGILLMVPILATLQHGIADRRMARVAELLGFVPPIEFWLALTVVLAVARALLTYYQRIGSLEFQNGVVDRLRQRAYTAVLRAEWRWLVQSRASDNANLIITNVARVGQGLNQLAAAIALAFGAVGYLAAAFLLSWQLALLTIAVGGLVLAAFAAQRRRALHFGHALGRAGKALHGHVHEGFAGVRIIKAYAIEQDRAQGFAGALHDVRLQDMRNARLGGFSQGLLQVAGAIVFALVVIVGDAWWGVPLATLAPLLFVFSRLSPMLSGFQSSWLLWVYSRPAIAEMRAFLAEADAAREPPPDPAARAMTVTSGVELQDICVTYAGRDEPALNGVSLRLPANTTTALCGVSGAGKSTLADVLMGLIVPDGGRLLVDGTEIAGAARMAWRQAVAYVQQDPFLFHDTIRANILVGRDTIAPEDIEQALRRSGAMFVLDLPDGLDTMVGDGGVRLSGGERQRVALARALAGAPALVILDEATSALDPERELEVRRTMLALRGEVTLLFISHRESMREDADQVVVLDRGRVT